MVLGVGAFDRKSGKKSEVAGFVHAAGVDNVGEVEPCGFHAGLQIFEIFFRSDFTNSEDVGFFVDDDCDERGDFFFGFGSLGGRTLTRVALHREIIFQIVGEEAHFVRARRGFGSRFGWS